MYSNYIEERRSSSSSRQNSPGMNSNQRSPWQYDEKRRSQSQSGSLNNHSPEEQNRNPDQARLSYAQAAAGRTLTAYSTVAHPSHLSHSYSYHLTTSGLHNLPLSTAARGNIPPVEDQSSMGSCISAQKNSGSKDDVSPTRYQSAPIGDDSLTTAHQAKSDGRDVNQPSQKSRLLAKREQEETGKLRLLLTDRNLANNRMSDFRPEFSSEAKMDIGTDYDPRRYTSSPTTRNNPADQELSADTWGATNHEHNPSRHDDNQWGPTTTDDRRSYPYPDEKARGRSESKHRGSYSGSVNQDETEKSRKDTLLELAGQNPYASSDMSLLPKTRDEVMADLNRAEVHKSAVSRKVDAPIPTVPESEDHRQLGKKPRREGSRRRDGSRSRAVVLSEDVYEELLVGASGRDRNQGQQFDGKGHPKKEIKSRPAAEPMETDQQSQDKGHERRMDPKEVAAAGLTHISNDEQNEKRPAKRHGDDYHGQKVHGENRLARRQLHEDRTTNLIDLGDAGSCQWDQNSSRDDEGMAAKHMTGDKMKNIAGSVKSQNRDQPMEPDNRKGEEFHHEDEDSDDDAQYENLDAGKSKNLSEFTDKLSFIQNTCKKENKEDLTIYQATLRRHRGTKIRKLEYGYPSKSAPEKVIMLVGSTGAGKSTMMNAIFNYMFGIKWNDDYRMKLVPDEVKPGQVVNQAVSQTRRITAYTIHHQPWFTVPYTLTIIDTPGFGDTGGIKRDKQITEQIRNFFQTKDSNGIDHLDAVGFVTQSSLPRLAPAQRYVFDSILAIFGKDIEENIFMLLTFADGRKPQVLSGLKEANMKYQNFYKFNNSALYVGKNKVEEANSDEEDEDDDDNFDEMFWKMGATNFTKFMTDLESVKAQSLTLTAEVLEERHALETTVNSISEHVKRGLKKLEQLQIEQGLLKSHEADLHRNKNFTYEYQGYSMRTINLNDGKMAANCKNCLESCHFPCNHMFLINCRAISWRGDCRQCTEKCPVSFHEKQPFFYKWEEKTYRGTYDDIKRRYEDAEGKRFSAEQLIEKSKGEFDQVQKKTFHLMQEARECLAKLDEIALKPNPLSTTDYIDLMIQEEEFMKEPGWKETVKQLKEVKKRANDLLSATSESFDPFAKNTRTSTKM